MRRALLEVFGALAAVPPLLYAVVPMTDAYRSSLHGDVRIPLRSDPPWLRAGLALATAGSLALSAVYFRFLAPSHPPLGLSIVPGLALATFGGSALAWWARRRGGTFSLEASPHRLVLQQPRRRIELVDRSRPFGAMLVKDDRSGARALILSQTGEPSVVYDPDPNAAPDAPAWSSHSVSLDLGQTALSPDSSHTVTATTGTRIDAVLESLETSLTDETDWLRFPLPSGEVLRLARDRLVIGNRTATIGSKDTGARRIAINTPNGDIVALSILSEENSFLLALVDPSGTTEGVTPAEAPDAYLPVLIWSVIARRFGVDPGALAANSGSYRG
jgi:hypothetical protein